MWVWTANAWLPVDQNGAPPSVPAELNWSTLSPEEVSTLFLGDNLLFAIRPDALNGNKHTVIASDYVEVQVDYWLD
jgi:hypothetical protein